MNNKIENKSKNFIARQSVIFTSKMIELKNEQIKINNALKRAEENCLI